MVEKLVAKPITEIVTMLDKDGMPTEDESQAYKIITHKFDTSGNPVSRTTEIVIK